MLVKFQFSFYVFFVYKAQSSLVVLKIMLVVSLNDLNELTVNDPIQMRRLVCAGAEITGAWRQYQEKLSAPQQHTWKLPQATPHNRTFAGNSFFSVTLSGAASQHSPSVGTLPPIENWNSKSADLDAFHQTTQFHISWKLRNQISSLDKFRAASSKSYRHVLFLQSTPLCRIMSWRTPWWEARSLWKWSHMCRLVIGKES